MKSKLLIVSIFLTTLSAIAQDRTDDRRQMMEDRIESMKIAHITKALDLTTEEAKSFWPVYNEYQKEMKALRKDHGPKGHADKPEDLSDSEIEKRLEERFADEQKMLDIRKKYLKSFKEVLPIRKVSMLYRAEHDFKRKVIDELRKKRE
ncbi:MAG: hypothetical protein HKN92_02510 [Chitinophagales bacterium]|nr:hypothetical protein [Chitinophagales bacterium]